MNLQQIAQLFLSDPNNGAGTLKDIALESGKQAALGSASATAGLGGDFEGIGRLLNQGKQGYLDPERAMDTVLPTTDDVGESLGADIKSNSFMGGSFFGLDPTGPLGKMLGAALPLVMKLGKGKWADEITDALVDRNQIRKIVGDEGFDPRFDDRVREKKKMEDLTIEAGADAGALPITSIEDLAGRPFVTSMSDRLAAGEPITSIRGVKLNRPVGRHGGQDFMATERALKEGELWSSAETPVQDILKKADILEKQSGQPTIFAPWTMSPTGGDFSPSTGDMMLTFADANMDAATKAELNNSIKNFVTKGGWKAAEPEKINKRTGKITPAKERRRTGHNLQIQGFKGVEDPDMFEVWRNTPDSVRKELKNMMDKQYRNKGGLGIGEARIGISDWEQVNAKDTTLRNFGEIFPDTEMGESIHPAYPKVVRGEGKGQFKEEFGVFELLEDAVKQRNRTDARLESGEVMDILNPAATDVRALQMTSYGGRFTDKAIRAIKDKTANKVSAESFGQGSKNK
jgi:hypothetical protein